MTHSRKTQVMIVDDDEAIGEVLKRILKCHGYDSQVYVDSLYALEDFKDRPTDIVLCDIEMPRLNGLDLMTEMKSISPKTSIAVVTGYGDTYSVREALVRGADEYIQKPFKSEELIIVMERLRWRLESRPA